MDLSTFERECQTYVPRTAGDIRRYTECMMISKEWFDAFWRAANQEAKLVFAIVGLHYYSFHEIIAPWRKFKSLDWAEDEITMPRIILETLYEATQDKTYKMKYFMSRSN